MTTDASGYLTRQLELAWTFASFHLAGLSTEECLWRPARVGLHVRADASGLWRADWPEHEGYDLGPPSIAWLTWHIGFWWSLVFDHSFGDGTLTREAVLWPGDADGVRAWLDRLYRQWRGHLLTKTYDDLRSASRTRWPFQDRPFGDVVAWANVELMKNAAEVGYGRFLYAVAR
jgi:DinB superfamily